MISVDKKRIYFQTKDRRKKKQDKNYNLLYALTCNTCNNVILAAFETDKEVDLWDYEESTVMHYRQGQNYGTFNYYYPTAESKKGDSCYKSTIEQVGDSKIQILRMRNHVLEPERTSKVGLERFEPGERTCMYNAVVSLRKDMALKQAAMITGQKIEETVTIDWEKHLDELVEKNKTSGLFLKESESYGEIPIYGILIPKERIQYNTFGVNYYNYKLKA